MLERVVREGDLALDLDGFISGLWAFQVVLVVKDYPNNAG